MNQFSKFVSLLTMIFKLRLKDMKTFKMVGLPRNSFLANVERSPYSVPRTFTPHPMKINLKQLLQAICLISAALLPNNNKLNNLLKRSNNNNLLKKLLMFSHSSIILWLAWIIPISSSSNNNLSNNNSNLVLKLFKLHSRWVVTKWPWVVKAWAWVVKAWWLKVSKQEFKVVWECKQWEVTLIKDNNQCSSNSKLNRWQTLTVIPLLRVVETRCQLAIHLVELLVPVLQPQPITWITLTWACNRIKHLELDPAWKVGKETEPWVTKINLKYRNPLKKLKSSKTYLVKLSTQWRLQIKESLK